LQVIREEKLCEGWTIDDRDRAKVLLKVLLGYRGMKWHDADIGVVSGFISYCKSQLWKPEDDAALQHANGEKRMIEAYRRYEVEIADNRLLTFDDMLVRCADALRDEATRAKWAVKYDYVLQDEAQDANPAQLFIAEAMSRDHRNYMVVGDPAQSIYGWRGSRPEYVMKFEESWPGATVVTMNRNYRCGSKIIAVANEAIRPAECRLPADLIAEGGWEGGVSHCRECDLDAEAERIAAIVMDNHNNGEPYEAHTVLFRTNAQSRALEEVFLTHKIPHVVVGGTSFYERKEVKDLLAYLRTAMGQDLPENVRRCVNAPFRYIGAVTVDKLLDALARTGNIESAVDSVAPSLQRRQSGSLYDWLEYVDQVRADDAKLVAKHTNQPDLVGDTDHVGTIIDNLERAIGYIAWLKKDQGEEGLDNSHVANVKELIRVASRFKHVAEFLHYVDETIEKAKEAKRDNQVGRVLLMSIHRSKGLEWPYVFVAGCAEGILPHPMGDEEEERRLFYVAVTRAVKHAYLTTPGTLALRTGLKRVETSRFVQEVASLIATVGDASHN
jgi:DNA helicase-2/ATP-dependent DNA helicase PcrA